MKNINEVGRSMVEMLGILAIVGVISIGGVAGYVYGMDRYRTNELLDGASKRAYAVATQLSMEIPPDLKEFKDYDEAAGGTFVQEVREWEADGEFGIKITGVKEEICENLIRMIGENTPLRAITKTDETELSSGDCEPGENNNIYLVYNVEMLSKAGTSLLQSGNSSTGGTSPNSDECENGAEKIDESYGACCDQTRKVCPEDYAECILTSQNCCAEEDKHQEAYAIGECCDGETTGMFCPGETPPTCTPSPSC